MNCEEKEKQSPEITDVTMKVENEENEMNISPS